MKKNVFLVLVCSMFCTGVFAQEEITVSRFEGQTITGLDVSGGWEIHLTQGTSTQVVLTFPARFEKQLLVRLDQEGKVEIGFKGNINSGNKERFIAEVVCSSLKEVELSGACRLKGKGNFTGDGIKFDLSGFSQVNMAGEVNAGNYLETDISGASRFSGYVVAGKYSMDLSGSSDITLSGKAVNADIEASGASKVNLEQAVVRLMNVELSGASYAAVNVTERIAGEISGTSKLVYSGEATAHVDVSGASSLKRN